MDVRRISSTWLHSTWQTLIDGNSGRRIPEQPIVLALAQGPVEKSFFTHETFTVSDTGLK